MTDRSRQLADTADDLEAVKAEMEERGSSMTDGTPLVNIRKSLARMKQEVVTMDVRIGVVQHTLLQAGMLSRTPFLNGYQLLGFFSLHRLAFLRMF